MLGLEGLGLRLGTFLVGGHDLNGTELHVAILQIAELLLVLMLEGLDEVSVRRLVNQQRSFGHSVSNLGRSLNVWGTFISLLPKLLLGLFLQIFKMAPKLIELIRSDRLVDATNGPACQRREAHANCTQQRRTLRENHPPHSQLVGDCTGVLAGGTAEGHQSKITGIITFDNGDAANGFCHFGVGNLKPAQGQLSQIHLGSAILQQPFTPLSQLLLDCLEVQSEGKLVSGDAPKPNIQVRDSQWSSSAVAGRTGISTRALRPHTKHAGFVPADRTTSGGNRFDGKRR